MEKLKQAEVNWHATKQENELKTLEDEVRFLETASPKQLVERYEELIPAKFQKVEEENAKLKYQLTALERSLKAEDETFRTHLPSIVHALGALFDLAIRRCEFPLEPGVNVLQPQVTPATKAEFGDYQCNNAMGIFQVLKSKGSTEYSKPLDVAKRIVENLPRSRLLAERVDVAPSGFINLRVAHEFVAEQVRSLLLSGVRPPATKKHLRVVVDYSSPNIAKEMHVGHLRSTIIGDAICNLLVFLGHDVKRVNHVGDWGTQFGMLTAYLFTKFPELQRSLAASSSLEGDVNEKVLADLSDLNGFYKASKKQFDVDDAFKKLAHDYVVRLQSGDTATRNAWQLICNVSRREFERIYQRLGIRGLEERGESFYQSRMQEVVEDLRARKLLELDEGRQICWPTEAAAAAAAVAAAARAAEAQADKDKEKEKHEGSSVVPLTIVKSDGAFTYDTSDLAAMRYRICEDRADWLVYVVDAGQAVHFNGLFGVARRLGWLSANAGPQNSTSDWLGIRADHVMFGVVLGEDKKRLKSRSGETVRLVDLLDEGLTRSGARLAERGRDRELSAEELQKARSAIAYGCIKYADLSHNRTNDYVFSFDKMLDDKGNTAVYLLYAYTRIRSIARNAGLKAEDVRRSAQSTPLRLEHAAEWRLAKQLLRFAEVCITAADNLYPHYVCDYLYELSCVFTEFYDVCYCIEKDANGQTRINHERVLLCEATAAIMKKCFDILGLETVERM